MVLLPGATTRTAVESCNTAWHLLPIMEHSTNNSSGHLTNAIKGLQRFDRRKPGEVRDWHKRLAVVLGVTRRDIASLIKGKSRSTEETSGAAQAAIDKTVTDHDRSNEDLYAILYPLTEKLTALLVSKSENTTGTSVNGLQALLELVGNNNVADAVIRSTMGNLMDAPMHLGQDPDDFFMEKSLARFELEKEVNLSLSADFCVQVFTLEYKDITLMMYRDPTVDIDEMQRTIVHFSSRSPSRFTRRRFYPQRSSSGQAVVTGVVASSPRYLTSLFVAHRVKHSHCSSICI